MQFITPGCQAHGGVGEEEGVQTRGIQQEQTRELIYIDTEPGRKIGQNLELERGFDDSVDLERGLEQKARALQQAEEAATMTGGAYLIPWVPPGKL